MKGPSFQLRFTWLVWAALLPFSGVVSAQPTDNPAKKPAARTKPQVIYHLPSSNYAATLHSQEKGQNPNPPAEGPAPTSSQPPRENSNPGAATGPSQELKHPKGPSNPSMKSKGRGNSRHKK
jgi:hypothetical protein